MLSFFSNLAPMFETQFERLVVLVLFSAMMFLTGLYLLANYNSLFRRYIRYEMLRRNIVVWMIAICFILSITPTSGEFFQHFTAHKVLRFFLVQITAATV